MLKCKIIFKGVEYTHEGFRDYVLANGMGALGPPTKVKIFIGKGREERNKALDFPIYKDGKEIGGVVVSRRDGKGWAISNARIVELEQGKGIGKQAYRELNKKSMEDTGYPLTSGVNLTLAAKGLWDSLIKNGEAEKINDETYQFKLEAQEEEAPSKLATDIINKYDWTKTGESVDELWTRLEMIRKGIIKPDSDVEITEEDVRTHLNPTGQLTDYATQEEIRYNTYSGIDLTGISANFGKTFAYVLDATPITVIKDTTTGALINTNSPEYIEIQKTEKVYSVEALLEKSGRYKVQSRGPLTINKKHRLSVDGVELRGLRRNSIAELGEVEDTINVFETVDTVINLAIDNVKEQKLAVLGITSANANAYMSLIGMGVSLNIASKIFKTPILKEANENSRWTRDLFSEKYSTPMEEELLGMSSSDMLAALTEFTGSERAAQTFYGKLTKNSISELIDDLSISTEVLDKIYTGQASPALKLISDLVVVASIKRMMPVGEELFEYAQIFSVLRGLPNKKWRVDSIIDKIESHNTFRDEANTGAGIKEATKLELLTQFRRSEAHLENIDKFGMEVAEKMAKTEIAEALSGKNANLFGTIQSTVKASFVNRVLRNGVNRAIEGNNSVFENIAVLRIPHVFAAYKALLQLRSILENSFAVYNPTVQNFIKGILSEANIYAGSDSLEKVDTISKEFVKFISSNLNFELEGKPFSTSVPTTHTYPLKGVELRGKEAWSQEFIQKALILRDLPEFETNAFVRSLEIAPPDASGLYSIKIIGDKVNDEEILEAIREDFRKLTESNVEVTSGYSAADFAVDVFKHSLMSENMYYEKTGFALIFPSHWVVKFGIAMDNRLNSVIPKGQSKTDLNLAIMKDRFIFQFLKNNPNLVSKTTRIKPELQLTTKGSEKNHDSYAGKENVGGQDIYFDLKFNVPFTANTPKFLRRYDDAIYIVVPTPNSKDQYYVKMTEKSSSRFYNFDPEQIDLSLDLSALQTGKYPIINDNDVMNSALTTDYRTHLFEVGEVITGFPKNSSSASTLTYYKVAKVTKQPDKVTYALIPIKTVSITKINAAVELKDFMTRYIDESLGTTIPVDSLKEYRDIQFKNKRARLVGNNLTEEATAIKLPIDNMPPNLTDDDLVSIEKLIMSAIEELDPNLTLIVDAKILEPLNTYPLLRFRIAKALSSRIGFLEPAKEREDDQTEKTGALAVALKESELIAWTFENDTLVSPTTERGIATHTVKARGEMKKVNFQIGDFLSAGNGKYFYLTNISKVIGSSTELDMIEFGPEVFAGIQSSNISLEDFLQIYESKIKC